MANEGLYHGYPPHDISAKGIRMEAAKKGSAVQSGAQEQFWLAAAELCRALTKLAEKVTEELSKDAKG